MMKNDNEPKWVPATVMILGIALSGCKTGAADRPPESVIQIGEASSTSSSQSSSSSSASEWPDYPAQLLFEHAGFEFCCSQFGTYEAHGFAASGVVQMLDGGHWAEGIDGAQGERVFASYGDGFDDEEDTSAEWKGWELTGSLTTPEFEIPARYINFLAGGGLNTYDSERPTAVVLRVGGEVVRHATGNGQEASLSPVTWEVGEFIGQTGQIEIMDGHDDQGDDGNLPFILVDHIEASSSAATTPSGLTGDGAVELVYTDVPATEGLPLFTRPGSDQNIANFEFCCAQFNTYQEHGFGVTGDLVTLNGGEWAASVNGAQGERVFASFGEAFDSDGSAGYFLGWSAVGRVASPEFVIGRNFINFLIGGGSNAYDQPRATAVVLRVNGEVVRQASGDDQVDSVSWITWDVSALKGHRAIVEFIDNHPDDGADEALAYIMADEFRAADKAAETPVEGSVVSNVIPGTPASRLRMGDPNPYYENGTYHVFYLHDDGRHPWYLASTDDLTSFTAPREVLPVGSAADSQDNWTGSGSVIKDGSGDYHLFYTGHNQTITPVEAVMKAVADDVTSDSWMKQPERTFTGTNGYSDYDFRDPWVFWNADDNAYWMLLTSRYNDQAAIGLYTSDDLDTWTPQPPLYQETSDLNLEVPDLLMLDDHPFLLYSDQRDASRQVRHLVADGAGGWEYPDYDALDGRGYYAGRSAGPNDEKLLFGWVPHKLGKADSGLFRWGGDLVSHELYRNSNGDLSVKMPDLISTQLDSAQSVGLAWQRGTVTENGSGFSVSGDGAFTLMSPQALTRWHIELDGYPAADSFGIQFRRPDNGQQAFVSLSTADNEARFHLDSDADNPNDPRVAVPLNDPVVTLDLLLDPINEYGVLYINEFRALTFRFYDMNAYEVGLFSGDGLNVISAEIYQ